jgi:phenylacetate-CoA ligase
MSLSLRERQWASLRPRLERVLERNPFQRARWAGRDLPNSLEEFCAWFPRTTKGELAEDQRQAPPLGRNLTEASGDYVHFCQTSGTTAQPLSVVDTVESWEWLLENWRLGFERAGIRAGMRAYFAFSFGPFLGFWTAFEAAQRHGLLGIPGGGLSSVARLQAMERLGAEVLFCTPTYALHLAGVARQEGLALENRRLRRILVAGEPGGSLPAIRERLAQVWPEACVVDHYGMTEVGPVAFGSDLESGSLRILADRYWAEVLEPESGQAVAEGELGELTLTPLGREAWPLFRYRTGDLVRAKRGVDGELELLGGILGRVDDMVIVRGVNLYPGAMDQVVRSVPEIGEYRVTVESGGAMGEVTLEVESEAGPGVCGVLERALEVAFSLRISVRWVEAGTLPRFEFKARRWRRL